LSAFAEIRGHSRFIRVTQILISTRMAANIRE
jgi:hypothetical protein